jgi:hypothetical protein
MRPLSFIRLSIGNVLEFLYLEVEAAAQSYTLQVNIGLSIILYSIYK